MDWPKFIAHRGASAIAPENTVKALELAIELGAKCVEFDVQAAADGRLMVFHDATLQRATAIKQTLANVLSDELLAMQALYHFGPQQPPIYLADFDQYLTVLEKSNIMFNCEFKYHKHLSADKQGLHNIEPYLDRLINLKDRCFITSSHKPYLQEIDQFYTGFNKGLVSRSIDQATFEYAQQMQLKSISVNHSTLSDKLIDQAQHYNIALMAYTVNDYQVAIDLLNRGVTSIFSDVVFT